MDTSPRQYIILLAFLIVWPLPAYGQAAARVPTLRDEVRAKGSAYHIFVSDAEGPATLDGLIAKSDAIVRGRVVDEKSRLSDDEYQVLTDYTIEVGEVFKDVSGKLKEGDRITVTREGGNLLLEGHPVHCQSMEFPPLPWLKRHIFLLTRQKNANRSGWYYFGGLEAGVFPIMNGHVECGSKTQPNNPFIKPYCGMDEEKFQALIKTKLAESGNTAPGL